MGSKKWSQFAEDYDLKVFSLTKFPIRRRQLIGHIEPGLVLNLGCGSTHYLNSDLVDKGNRVISSDFCPEMLWVAREKFSHDNLEYVLADSRNLPFRKDSFDSVISVNSILPPERADVNFIASEIHRILKPGGIFVAFLVSYDSTEKVNNRLGLELKMDSEQLRVVDTTGWQCYHTPWSIKLMMEGVGFRLFGYMKVFLDTSEELAEIQRIYGYDSSKHPIYEYFLTASKIC